MLYVTLVKVTKHVFDTERLASFRDIVRRASSAMQPLARPTDTQLLVLPEYFWSRHTDRSPNTLAPIPFSRTAEAECLDEIARVSLENRSLVILAGTLFSFQSGASQNMAPVVQGGQFLLKNLKQMDDGFAQRSGTRFDPGANPVDPFFTVGGITFAMEICGEKGNLRVLNAASGYNPKVYIMVSDGMRPGGHGIPQGVKWVLWCDFWGNAMAFAQGGLSDKDQATPIAEVGPLAGNVGLRIYALPMT